MNPECSEGMSELFFIERINYQITYQKAMYSRGKQNEGKIAGVLTDESSMFMAFDEAIKCVKTTWIQGGCLDDNSDETMAKTGSKCSFDGNGARQQWAGPAVLQVTHGFNSMKLYECLRSVCRVNDWNPSL